MANRKDMRREDLSMLFQQIEHLPLWVANTIAVVPYREPEEKDTSDISSTRTKFPVSTAAWPRAKPAVAVLLGM